MGIKIIFEDDSELAEFEARNKGYRSDVIVITDNRRYKVYVTSILRLQQDFYCEHKSAGYYFPEPYTILVQETTRHEIEDTLRKLYSAKYFERIDQQNLMD